MRNVFISVSLVAFCSLFISCGIGPFIEQHPDKPKIPGAGSKKILVSQFVQSERYISFTESPNIVNILESASVKDISYQIAKAMTERGIQSEAIKNPAGYNLKENELLLKGAITPGRENANLSVLTAFLAFPILLPTPWSYPQILRLNYYYEISDHNGKILFSSEFKEIEGRYKNYYVYGLWSVKRYKKLRAELEKRIKDEIAAALR